MKWMVPRWLWVALALTAALNAPAQSTRAEDLAAGKLLVAPRNAPDPVFGKTVILLLQHDDDSAVGLIINRRMKVPISRALEEWKLAKDNPDPVYMGGPVELNGVMALVRSAKAADATHVFGDIYLASGRKSMEKVLAAGTGSSDFRIYLGYCGWGSGQLEHEMDLGAWYIFNGSSALVFDSDPGSLWSRLIARVEQQVAALR